MKKVRITVATVLLSFISVFTIVYFSIKNRTVKTLNESKVEVQMEDELIRISADNKIVHEETLQRPSYIEDMTLDHHEILTAGQDILLSIYIKVKETEESEQYDTLMVYSYQDAKFHLLFDGINDKVCFSENYRYTYLGDRSFNISLEDIPFTVKLKNILSYEDEQYNLDFEKDLISRMEHRVSLGYVPLSKGFHNINISQLDNEIQIRFSKYAYGFFHADIIGQIHYVYEYREGMESLLQEISFEPVEEYEMLELKIDM